MELKAHQCHNLSMHTPMIAVQRYERKIQVLWHL
uniref:Uncharacterized protein n=1 Tax=Arundo donax TaxID=35708 RepID=A0A0A9BQ02_ARUDO